MQVHRSLRSLIVGSLLSSCALGAALADPVPLPSTDFALKAKAKDDAVVELWHAGDKMRVVVNGPRLPATVAGIVDMKRSTMVMLLPDMPKMAVEAEVPDAYRTAVVTGEGTKVGTSQVIGEACDLWKITTSKTVKTPVVSCITADGIVLSTDVEVKGKQERAYEVTSLTRGPQDPSLFRLPPGTQLVKVPPGAANMLPGLMQGLGGLKR